MYANIFTDLLKLRDITLLPLVFYIFNTLKGEKTKQNNLPPEPKLQTNLDLPLRLHVPRFVQF